MTIKKQINLYLKERNIPISSLEANSIKEGIHWATERVCGWLNSVNTDHYMDSGIFQMYDLIQDFKKAMKE